MQPRSILVTGTSSGIGLCAAETMKARGWNVFATARKREDLAMLERLGVTPLFLDYADEASIHACVDKVLTATGGGLDALFNNGAYAQPGALEDIGPALMREQFEANFLGWHTLTRALVPAMRRQGHGRIVQCSSVLGLVGMKFRGPYVATKFALEGYSDVLRMELAPAGIHVSLIEPGPIATKFVENSMRRFVENIDHEASPHRDLYKRRLATLRGGGASRYKLGPEAVVEKLVHAVESPKPKARYRVTRVTAYLAVLRRVLSTRALDRIIVPISDAGN